MNNAVSTSVSPPGNYKWLVGYLFVAPAVFLMGAGLIYPVIQGLLLSMFDWGIGTPASSAEFIGFENYVRMVQDENVLTSMLVTFKFGIWTITIEMALGIALALLLEKPIRGASIFRTIFIMPLMISPVVVGNFRY